MKNIWELIQKGDFETACKEVDLEYEQTGNDINFGNKITALMHLKKYDKVIELADKMIVIERNANPSLDVSSSFQFTYSGIANWVLNKKEEAIKLWQQGEKSIYQDASGGVLLLIIEYFAGVRIKDEILKRYATKRIKKKLRNKQAANWPGPLGHYLLGDISEVELLNRVSTIPILRERNLCQVNFVMAIKELENENIFAYKNKLKECIQDGPLAYLESMFYLAKGELEMLETGQTDKLL